MSHFDTVLNLLVICLLGATCIYATMLYRQIGRLRSSRDELAVLLGRLNESVSKAENAIQGLRVTAEESGGRIDKGVRRAAELADELDIICQSSDKLAERLEKLTSAGRENLQAVRALAEQTRQARPAAPAPSPAAARPKALTRAEQELADTLARIRAQAQGAA